MTKKGWKEVDIKESIHQALEDSERFGACFLSWADQEDRLSILLRWLVTSELGEAMVRRRKATFVKSMDTSCGR